MTNVSSFFCFGTQRAIFWHLKTFFGHFKVLGHIFFSILLNIFTHLYRLSFKPHQQMCFYNKMGEIHNMIGQYIRNVRGGVFTTFILIRDCKTIRSVQNKLWMQSLLNTISKYLPKQTNEHYVMRMRVGILYCIIYPPILMAVCGQDN